MKHSLLITELQDGRVRIDRVIYKKRFFGIDMSIEHTSYAMNMLCAIELLNIIYGGQMIMGAA